MRWFVFLDAGGKVLIHSTGPNGNVRFPAKPDEIACLTSQPSIARRAPKARSRRIPSRPP
jgi:hypothetical protein